MIVWIASYPKSGNTWVRTIINQIIFNDLKQKDSVFDDLSRIRRYPSKIDMTKMPTLPNSSSFNNQQKKEIIDFTIKNWAISQEKINQNNKTNILKTHNMLCNLNLDGKNYSFTGLDNTIGVIHVVRDPRNVVTSIKNHFSLNTEEESVKMICDKFNWTGLSNNEVPQLLSSWENHYNSWKRFPKNYLLVKYEDLIKNPINEFGRIEKYLSDILEVKFDKDKIKDCINNNSFDNLKKIEEKQGFIEATTDTITNKKRKFFNLGPENIWQNLLPEEIRDSIENKFGLEMKELNYINK